MAKNEKIKGSINADKRGKIILGIVIAVLAIFAIGYFVYISGLLPKAMTGVKVVKTSEAGTEVVENISVLEANFHYYQVINTYAQQGYLQNVDDIDAVADEATGKTFRQFLLDQAAKELMNIVFVNDMATQSGFVPYSGADRVAELSLQQMETQATMYGYQSVDTYLTAMYGAGMTTRAYKEFYARQILTNEYEQYVRQFVFTATEEEIQAAYDENPTIYERADFNYYYFPYDLNEDGTYNTSSADSNVRKVMRATDTESFKAKVIEALGEDQALIAGFTEDANPAFYEKYTSARTDTMAAGLTDLIFGEDAEAGVVKTIEVDTGVYVVLLVDKYLDEEPVVSYRTLTLYNEDYDATNAADVTAAQIAALTTEATGYVSGCATSMDFMQQVKIHSDSMNEIVYGGFQDGVTEANYQQFYDAVNENGEQADPASTARANVGHWLFDGSRAFGDTYVYVDPNNQFVTVYFFENSVPSWVYNAQTQLLTAMVNGWSSSVVPTGGNYMVAYDLIRRLTTPL